MQNLSFEKQFSIIVNEIFDKRRLVAISFSIISITILLVGLQWPKSYESTTTLLWNKASALKPLLEGTAEVNAGNEQSRIAREVIYSNKNLQILIDKTGLNYSSVGEILSDREIEILKAQLRKLILIKVKSNNTLRISYKNSNPDLAFHVVSTISQLFLEESTLKKKTDSYGAYNFINKQVNEYQEKLEKITKNINEFKSQNIELQIDTAQNVNARLSSIKEQIKTTSIELREAIIYKESITEQIENEKIFLVEQLVIESAKSDFVEEENRNNKRLIDLEDKLSVLRLSYTESYPDIIQIKEQIKILKESIEDRANEPPGEADTLTVITDIDNMNKEVRIKSPLYQKLQQELSTVVANIKILSARKVDLDNQFTLELARSSEVSRVFYRLEELSRDYNATKALYDKLSIKREDARVSLNLENEKAGSLYKVQEPPTIPLVPDGLRFLHFALGSMVLGVGIPLAIIIGLLMIDPRIRHEDDVGLGDEFPVIGVISNFQTGKDLKNQRSATIQSVLILSLSLITWFTLALSKYYEFTLPFAQIYELLLSKYYEVI